VPFELFVALRYLAASRRRAHVALVSAISVAGLALGVTALVVSIALLTGFQDRIRQRLDEATPHLRITPARGEFFADPEAVTSAVSALPGLRSITPVVAGRGWISDSKGLAALPLRYRASGDSEIATGEAAVAAAVAGQLGVGVGSRILIVSGRTVLSPLGPVPVSVALSVSRLLRSGPIDEAPDAEISLSDARILAGGAHAVSAFAVRLDSASAAPAAAERLDRVLSGKAVVRTWRQFNVGLDFALRMEKVLIFAAVFLIVLVASLNIVSDLSLLVVEKRRDLGVLATLGAEDASLSRIYLWLGGAIGVLGTGLGLGLGAGLSWALDHYALVPLPADVYLMSHIPFALHARDLLLVTLFSLATALAAAAMPARSASRIGPAEALRLSQ
jgi:lipoprotein-releasing system permease protein